MLKQITTRDLFFEVKKSKLHLIINNEMVKPERYKVLHEGIKFLGLKPTEKDSKDIFYIKHIHAYKCAKVLAESISSFITLDRSYTNELKNKAFIFLGKEKDTKVPALPEESLFGEFDKHVMEQLYKYGFSPAIAVQNGYDYPDKTTFYLLVELSISDYTSGYLTIAKHKFKNKTIQNILDLPQKKEEYCIHDVKEYGVPSFRKALEKFVNVYEALSDMKATSPELVAIALDIFNKNRNLESLKSDENLLKEMHRFISSAKASFDGKNHLGHLINFMVQLHFIDFGDERITPSVVSDILTEKKAYGNLDRLLTGKNKDEGERKKYIKEQVRVYKQIP